MNIETDYRPTLVGVDLLQYVIIASACMAAFRHKYLQRNTIAYFTPSTDVHSTISIRWLEYVAFSEQRIIHHARNRAHERQVGPYKGDGFFSDYDDDGTLVQACYEMNGCWCHSHETCFPERRWAREKQSRKEQHLRKMADQVCSIWECEFRQMEACDPKYRSFHKRCGGIYPVPLNARGAFFGGRTNAFCLYHKVKDGEHVEYVDFTSLYPYINKTGRYPEGHPTKILNRSLDILYKLQYLGVAKVRVVPPTNLFNGKLMFVLCKSCVVTQCSNCPTHELNGSWRVCGARPSFTKL